MGIEKVASGTIYLGIIFWSIKNLENTELYSVIAGALIPVLLIWFPEEINEITLGSFGEGGTIDKPTPAILISGFGWIVLLGIPLIFLLR